MRLVIARYSERLDWLAEAPAAWQVFVYNKGAPLGPLPRSVIEITIPNIGREAETFSRHNATADLCEWTAFLQGNPFDHWPDPIEHIQRIISRQDRVGWLGFHYDTDWNVPPHTLCMLGLSDVWSAVEMEGPCPGRCSFPAGAQMVVHGSVIERRRREWWQRAAAVSATTDWRVAHCFERMWPDIYK